MVILMLMALLNLPAPVQGIMNLEVSPEFQESACHSATESVEARSVISTVASGA